MIPTDSIVKLMATHHPLGGLGNQHQPHTEQPGNLTPRPEPFPAWSVIDEAKKTAVHEYEAASQTAQKKAGKIELWTPKYDAACTFGGLLACVSDLIRIHCDDFEKGFLTLQSIGSYPHGCYALGPDQMSPSS